MAIKEFTSAVREAEEGDKLSFKVDGRKIVAKKPKQAIFAQIALSTRSGTTVGDRLEATYAFFGGKLDEKGNRHGGVISLDDWNWMEERLNDSEDYFDLDVLMEIIEYVVEEFAGNPTTSSTD